MTRTVADVVSEALRAFGQEHRACGGLRGVMWLTGVWGWCDPCDAKLALRFEQIRRMLNEEKEHWS